MASESELRSSLRDGGDSLPGIDVKGVLSRSRSRRRRRELLVGGVTAVAALGILVPVAMGGLGGAAPASESTTAGSADLPDPLSEPETDAGPGAGGEEGIGLAPVSRLNLCGGTLAEVAPASSGLRLSVDFPDAAIAEQVSGIATLTNTGAVRITGTTSASPWMTLSRDGVVLWHTEAMILIAAEVDLDPGESVQMPASVQPVECAVEDDADGFRAELPVLPPGEYEVSGALEIAPVDGSGPAELVVSPTDPVTLR